MNKYQILLTIFDLHFLLFKCYKDSPGIVESPDGTALFLGLPNDIIVLDPVTHEQITSWKVEEEEEQKEEEGLQAGSITTVQIGVQACLVISITKQGTAKSISYVSV